MENVLQSYLVKLGFSPDLASYRKFDQMLHLAESSVELHASGIVKTMLKMQFGVLGAFTSISAGIVAMADKVAMADQGYRLMGLRMMMTTESARKLSMITEGLGASLDQIVWDPELHQRALVMSADIDRLTQQLGPNFEANMKHIRDLRFEFTRLEVSMKFLGMGFVSDLFQKLGLNANTLTRWVDQFSKKIPTIANELSSDAIPILKQTWYMFEAMGGAAKEFGVLFTNVVGLLTGDSSIEGASFSFRHLAKSIEDVVHVGAEFFQWMTLAEKMLLHFTTGISDVLTGHFKAALGEMKSGLGDMTGGSGAMLGLPAGFGIGSVVGGAAGSALLGPLGTAIGIPLGSAIGGVLGALTGYGAGKARERLMHGTVSDLKPAIAAMSLPPRMAEGWTVASEVSAKTGIPAKLIFEQFQHETDNFTNRGARKLHNFAGVNVPGGTGKDYRNFGTDAEFANYYSGLLMGRYAKYGVLQAKTPAQFASALKAGGYFSDSLGNYTSGMERFANADAGLFASLQRPTPQIAPAISGMPSAPSIQVKFGDIHIMQPNLDQEGVQRAVAEGARRLIRSQSQVSLAQLSPAF